MIRASQPTGQTHRKLECHVLQDASMLRTESAAMIGGNAREPTWSPSMNSAIWRLCRGGPHMVKFPEAQGRCEPQITMLIRHPNVASNIPSGKDGKLLHAPTAHGPPVPVEEPWNARRRSEAFQVTRTVAFLSLARHDNARPGAVGSSHDAGPSEGAHIVQRRQGLHKKQRSLDPSFMPQPNTCGTSCRTVRGTLRCASYKSRTEPEG